MALYKFCVVLYCIASSAPKSGRSKTSGPINVQMGLFDPDHAPFRDDLSPAGWDLLRSTCVPNLKFSTVPSTRAVQNVENRVDYGSNGSLKVIGNVSVR